MTKLNQLTEAERMYVYDKKSLNEIGIELGLSRRILFYWKKEYNWDKKRFDLDRTKEKFSKELLYFARKMMKKISTGIDNNQRTPQSEMYSLMNILKNIPQVKEYESSIKTEAPKPQTALSPEFIKQIQRDILGMK